MNIVTRKTISLVDLWVALAMLASYDLILGHWLGWTIPFVSYREVTLVGVALTVGTLWDAWRAKRKAHTP